MSTYHKPRRRSKKRRRQIFLFRLAFALCCLLLLALLVLGGRALISKAKAHGSDANSAPASSQALVDLPPETAPEASPEPEAPPEVDYESLNAQKGKDFMAWLTAQPGFTNLDLTVQEKFPYLLCVNRDASTVTVYTADEENRYTKPYMAMLCSGGSDTPTGHFNTPIQYSWRLLAGPCYGQYATRIWDCYLFHSVPYYTQHKDDLEYDEFNKLGTPASLGCIRLAVVDVKWIFDNCLLGTPVVIYDNAEDPGPLGKPEGIQIDTANVDVRGWDPTDPDPANPYGDTYIDGTAIRSAQAAADWEAYKANGLRLGMTPTDLQGWNHDSAIEGTRG